MRFICYSGSDNGAGRRLFEIVPALKIEKGCECYGSIDDLIKGLRQPMGLRGMAILCPSGEEDLNRLLAIRPLLRDLRVILILPDDRSRTISEGHGLRPRFVGYADGDFSAVAAVVEKMGGNNR